MVEPNLSTQGIAVLANSLELNGGAISRPATRAEVDLAHDGLEHDPDHKVDWQQEVDTTPPAVSSAEVDGSTVTVTFDEDLASVNSAGTLHLYWQVSGAAVDQHPYKASVSGRTVTLTIGTAATAGQTISVSYSSSGGLEDAAGNEVESFSVAATNLTE